MSRRIASFCLVILSLLLLAFAQLQLGNAHASALAAAATATRTRTLTRTRTPTRTLTPSRTTTPVAPVTGSVTIQNVGAAYGGTGHITATFSAQGAVAQVTQMRMVAAWSSQCIDPTNYAWEALITSQVYDYTNWDSDSYFSVAVQYQDALGNLSPVYCSTIVVPGAPTPTPTNTPTLIPTLSVAAPDLIVSISVAYQTGTFAGNCRLVDAPVAVQAVIQNIGTVDAGPFTAIFNGSTYNFTGLAAGQTVSITPSFGQFLPYARTATVDSTNAVVERDENNNKVTAIPTIAPMCTATPVPTADPVLPDLLVSSIKSALDPSIQKVNGCYPGGLVYGTAVNISNIGGVSAGPFSVTLNIGGVDYFYLQSVPGLAAGQSLSVWFNAQYSSLPVTAMVDSANAVVESNENNSLTIYASSGTSTPTGTQPPSPTPCKTYTPTPGTLTPTATATPTITLSPTLTPVSTSYPDLVVSSVTYVGSSPTCANNPKIQVVVSNIGAFPASGSFQVTLAGGVAQTVNGLAAGQSATLIFSASSAMATVDSTNLIVETNETNNSLTGNFGVPTQAPTCTPTGPTPTRTSTPTPTITPTLNETGCSPVTSIITAPFAYDGTGTFCWQSSNLGTAINSWNLTSLKINGVTLTNLYLASSSYPAKIGGYWYVSYSSAVAWGHFEAK